MARIFVSYSNSDRPFAERLIRALRASQIDVWWDGDLSGGDDFQSVIDRNARSADAMIVLWSKRSITSAWVLTEADWAKQNGKLIQIVIDDVRPPLGFIGYIYADLRGWDGDIGHPAFLSILRSLTQIETSHVLSGKDPGAPKPPERQRNYSKPRGASATTVFIAHASDDKPRLKPLIEVFLTTGFNVWVDKPQAIGLAPEHERAVSKRRIKFGQDWRDSIRTAVAASDVVLGFWSKLAIAQKREQFHYELYQGLCQNKLHQCRIDKIAYDEIGTPYTFQHIADLADFKTADYHEEMNLLMADLAAARRSAWSRWLPKSKL